MILSTPPKADHMPPSKPGLTDLRSFRIALVMSSALVLLFFYLEPSLYELRHDGSFFPVWLHTIMESFSIVVSIMVFAVSWHAYRPEQPSNITILACGFLAVGLLDFAHMVSYLGMPEFATPSSPQKAISFWLCARIVSVAVLLMIAFREWRPLLKPQNRHWIMAITLSGVVTIFYLQLWQPGLWPQFFVDGVGATPAKIAIEWLAIAGMSIVCARLWGLRHTGQQFDIEGILTASLMLILTSLALILYANVYDIFSLLGHIFKVVGYYMIYRIAFVASVRKPYDRLAIEITQKENAQQQVEILEFYDPLTKLPNKTQLRDSVSQAMATSQREKSHVGLVLLNLDAFGSINDSLGHAYGDDVLRAIADRLHHCIRETDSIFRIGGDEFAILLRNLQESESIKIIEEKIACQMAMPVKLLGQETRITASIGVAIAPADGETFDDLLQNADTALHKAKSVGGNTWRFFDASMNRDVVERLNLRQGLQLALDRQEFSLHYQPQYDLKDGALIGVEALVRWQHPERGILPPVRFIGEAETSGLIVPIGQWIMREACRQAMEWRQAGLHLPLMAINLSAVQLQRDDVDRLVLDALAESGLPASALELELTESILIHDTEKVLSTVKNLKSRGVHLSIDDFGTGYSSLSYLRAFPIDKLKIDQSFVRELNDRDDSKVIITTIIQLAKSLGLKTIAEGVEVETVAAELRRMGCDQAQGYFYARPMPAADMTRLLQQL